MTPAGRRSVLALAAAGVFVNFLCLLGLTPLYPEVARDLHTGVDGLGAYFALSAGVAAALQLPVGVLADRIGRRPVLLAGLAFMTLAQVLRWLSGSPPVFAAAQLTVGFCSPLVVASCYALVADAYAAGGRAQALGLLGAAVNLGQVSGFLVAGTLGAAAGWRQFSLIAAALPILLVVPVLRLREPVRAPVTGRPGASMRQALAFLLMPAAGGLGLVAALALGGGFSFNYLLPFVARAAGFGQDSSAFLLIPYIAGSVIGAPLAGRLADRLGVRGPLAGVLLLGALAGAAFAALPFSLPLLLVANALAGAATQSALGLASSAIAQVAVEHGRGTGAALGGLRVAQQLGPAVGPASAGAAYAHAGSPAAYGVLAVYFLAGAVLALAVTTSPARRPPTSPSAAPGPLP